jgi:hypothetical protein
MGSRNPTEIVTLITIGSEANEFVRYLLYRGPIT